MPLGIQARQPVRTAGGRMGQWWTPTRLADRFALWGNVRGLRVIDLGAGRGALSAACRRAGAQHVTAVEIDVRFFDELEGIADRVIQRDVRALDVSNEDTADVAIANPPFEEELVADFVHVGLTLAPRMLLLAPAATLFGSTRAKKIWSGARVTREALLATRPCFGGARNGMQDIGLFELVRRIATTTGDTVEMVERQRWEGSWQ